MANDSADATAIVIANAFGAMMKIFLVSVIGVLSAKYPEGNPLLPTPVIKHISRFSNIVMVPCLIIGGLGASLSLNLLRRVGILIPLSILNNLISMGIGRCLSCIHEQDEMLFKASVLTVASPNTISMPLMVMQSLCEQEVVYHDFDDDKDKCFAACTSLLFIYSIGFHILFWGYVFPSFEILQKDYAAHEAEDSPLIVDSSPNETNESSTQRGGDVSSKINQYVLYIRRINTLVKHVILSPSMLGIFAGITIGLIRPLQTVIFSPTGYLYPIGGAIQTLATPVVALNCLIMSASLAHVKVDFSKFWCYSPLSSNSAQSLVMTTSTHNPILILPSPPPSPPLVLSAKHMKLNDLEMANRNEHDNIASFCEGRDNESSFGVNNLAEGVSDTDEYHNRSEGKSDGNDDKHVDLVVGDIVKTGDSELLSANHKQLDHQDESEGNVPKSRSILFLVLTRY